MEDRDLVQQLIVQLLLERSPEFGARLKQRLNLQLASRGLGGFDEKAFGHRKFSAYLKSAFGDKIVIDHPVEAGDITVSLRASSTPKSANSTGTMPSPDHALVIRSDVWQAFTNPDPSRIRLYDKETKRVRHFTNAESSALDPQPSQDPDRYIEIERIDGDVQQSWMRDFLASSEVHPDQHAALGPLVSQAYSSSVNAAFTRALGERSQSWRHFRTSRVVSAIRAWATRHGVDFPALCMQRSAPEARVTPENRLTSRQHAIKLLELLTNEDISRDVIPALLRSISRNACL